MPLPLQALVNPAFARALCSPWRAAVLALLLVALTDAGLRAQDPAPVPQSTAPAPPGAAAMVTYANRPIIELRAEVFGRRPADRAAAAVRVLDRVVASGDRRRSLTRAIPGGILLAAGHENVLDVSPADVDACGERRSRASRVPPRRACRWRSRKRQNCARPGRMLRAVYSRSRSPRCWPCCSGCCDGWTCARPPVCRSHGAAARGKAAGVALVASQLVDVATAPSGSRWRPPR
jgi:hypothetical protein